MPICKSRTCTIYNNKLINQLMITFRIQSRIGQRNFRLRILTTSILSLPPPPNRKVMDKYKDDLRQIYEYDLNKC